MLAPCWLDLRAFFIEKLMKINILASNMCLRVPACASGASVATDGASWSCQMVSECARLYQIVPHCIRLVPGVTQIIPNCTILYQIVPD